MKNRFFVLFNLFLVALVVSCKGSLSPSVKSNHKAFVRDTVATDTVAVKKPELIDTARFNQLNLLLANGDTSGRWPVKHQPYPLAGAILPFHRIVAYYGNLYSTRMGVLGEYPKKQMLQMLKNETAKWAKADSYFGAVPALHYICVTAQGSAGADGKYRARMPFHQIDTVLSWANEIGALVFLDVQVGLSTLQAELPRLESYLALPNVHLGIDPEFSMKGGQKPGTVIGSFDSDDINYATNFLREIVQKNNLPPKVLVVHRFTQKMVQGYKKIALMPEVQVVIDMDGWGEKARKINTYKLFVEREPVQYTGFKIFYKNDTKRVNKPKEMQPEDVLKLRPVPIYIQYQ